MVVFWTHKNRTNKMDRNRLSNSKENKYIWLVAQAVDYNWSFFLLTKWNIKSQSILYYITFNKTLNKTYILNLRVFHLNTQHTSHGLYVFNIC